MYPEKHILIVEDNRTLADDIETEISGEFPCVVTHIAYTAEEAERCIRESKGDFDFDYVILDTRLPPSDRQREPQAYAYELEEVRWLMGQCSRTVVIFNSAYDDDPKVQRIREECTRLPGPGAPATSARLFYVQKGRDGSYEWINELLGYLRRTIHSKRISLALETLFVGRDPAASYAGAVGKESAGTYRDATQPLAALARDITRNWHHLDEATKKRVESHFRVEVDDGKVRVS
jgi:hypothetical protein